MTLFPTPSQTAGPYFHIGCTNSHSVGCLAGPQAAGERVWLHCRVLDGEGNPLNDAMLELWQADSKGKYSHLDGGSDAPGDPHCTGFGRLATDEQGQCMFETIKPGPVPGPDGTKQAPHINVSVFARGILKRLPTRLYFGGEHANTTDPILALVPEERRSTLLAQPDPKNPGHWTFDIHLNGANETVFFDI